MRQRRVVLILATAVTVLVLVLLVLAARSGPEPWVLISGVFAVLSLGLMLFTDVMFGKHERSDRWDEFLHRPPPPQE